MQMFICPLDRHVEVTYLNFFLNQGLLNIKDQTVRIVHEDVRLNKQDMKSKIVISG
jgi:hypothetical protein